MSVQRIDRNSVKRILDGYVDEKHLVVIKFYGAQCGYCHNLAPFYKELSDKYDDIYFYAFNMDEGDGFEEKYDFYGVPTICFVHTDGPDTKFHFMSDPEEPASGDTGTWYRPQELIDFLESHRRVK